MTVTLTVDASSRVEKTSFRAGHARIDRIVENAEVAAEFSGDSPDHCDVLAYEIACRFDENSAAWMEYMTVLFMPC